MASKRDFWAACILVVNSFAAAGLAFCVTIALARSLGPEDYGRFASALAVLNMFGPAVAFGLPAFWLKVYGEEGSRALRWMRPSMHAIIVSGALAMCAALAFAFIVDERTTMRPVAWMLPVVLTQAAIEVASARFQLEERFTHVAMWQTIQHVGRLVVIFACWKACGNSLFVAIGFGVVGACVAVCAAFTFRALCSGTVRLVGHAENSDASATPAGAIAAERPTWQQVWRAACGFGVSNVLYVIYLQSGIFVVGHIASERAAAVFSIGMTVAGAIYLLPTVLYQRLLMARFHRWSASNSARLAQATLTGVRWMFAAGLVCMGVVMMLATPLIPRVFGVQYAIAVPVVTTIALCAPFRFVATCALAVLNTGTNIRLRNLCAAIVLFFSVVVTTILAARYGAFGAACAVVASEALLCTLSLVAAFRFVIYARPEKSGDDVSRGGMLTRANLPITVIVPCYNCESSIERAVMSIAAQTCRPAEVILVDDCSTDKTVQLIELLIKRFEAGWIRLIRMDRNSGPGRARNEAWRVATQPYIAFLDSDDSWHPQKLELQYDWMSRHPDAAMTGHPVVQRRAGDTRESLRLDSLIVGEPKRVSRHAVLFSNRFTPSSILIRADVEARFDESKKYAEDYFLLMSLILLEEKLAYLFEFPLSYVYKRQFGATSGLSARLWKIQQGEQGNYRHFRAQGCISRLEWAAFSALSAAKYIRRCLLSRRFA